MPLPKSKTSSTDAIVGLWTISLASFIIAVLYFGRELLTPIALAALLTFLLAPLVTRLQRWLGRIGAVLLVVLMMFALTVTAGWILTTQIVDLGTQLPNYKENIRNKMHAFQLPTGGAFTKLSETFNDLKQDMPGTKGATGDKAAEGIQKLQPSADGQAIPVKVVSSPGRSPLELFQLIVAPIVGPLGTSALVLLLVVFMLLKREDLRGRLIRLIGQGRISATTNAMDDAASRVTRYLLMQLVVNVTYGIPIAVGLYFLGVPNAILWGTFATVLRFIPYVGPWIAASFPIILSLAVSKDWTTPLLTIGLFVGLELISNNVMEPWLYGSSTGVSSLALIVGAVFWTYIWGPVGLVMATPITVCLAVMGRHIPQLSFLNVILSDEEALTPAEDCYHRLLRAGGQDELELAESYLKQHTLTDLYDAVLIPALITAGKDHQRGMLDADQIDQVEHAVGELLMELEERIPAVNKTEDPAADQPAEIPLTCSVYCVPAKAERDHLAGEMFAQLLRNKGLKVTNIPDKLVASERLALVVKANVDVVCISVTEPSTVSHARYLCMKFRAALPNQKIMIGLWDVKQITPETEKLLQDAGADVIVKGTAEAYLALRKLAPPLNVQMDPAPVPANDDQRLKALHSVNLAKFDFQPFTSKMSRIFEIPIAMLSLVDRDVQQFAAQTGLSERLAKAGDSPRETSICGHVVAADETIIVEDLARDPRFANNPMIKENRWRFYAGAPVRSPDGHAIGSLCLIDTTPREFTKRERRLLNEYAADISNEIARAAKNANKA
jgi:predicted PurR-regulated permease PerM/methylmalonyl-CoA mutase cobalamin-binding subunit